VGFPLGLAVGRVGDLINGEHYGPASSLPWAVRHPHPDALVPSPTVAYHDGGLYEIVLGLVLAVAVWRLRDRLRRPGTRLWTVLGLYATGRVVMFFFRDDSNPVLFGLVEAQVASLGLLGAAIMGAVWSLRRRGGAFVA
jgi:phosphatidylglycerol---prolipoprotein diacylglyceryl transferase